MTINEIPNIEHCEVIPMGDPLIAYKLIANEGWYIHLNNGVEDTQNVYKTVVILILPYDFSIVDIVAEADLPADANICGDVYDNIPLEKLSEPAGTEEA